MATVLDSRSQLNVGTEETGYPPSGVPVGPINDPVKADDRLNPQLPASCIMDSLVPTGGPPATDLTLKWHVNLNTKEPLGWTNSAPSPLPQPNPGLAHYSAGWIDQWTSPYVNPGLPAPDSFNVNQVVRPSNGGMPSYVFVKNVAASLPG